MLSIIAETIKQADCLIFDLDGTLIQSNAIKRESFYTCTAHLEGSHQILDEIFNLKAGLDRYGAFDELSKKLGLDSHINLVDQYTDVCLSAIKSCAEVPGAMEFLDILLAMNKSLYICSATPEKDLGNVLRSRYLDNKFKAFYGSPQSKIEIINRILQQEKCLPVRSVVIGDGENDRGAAIAVGTSFVAVKNSYNDFIETPELVIKDYLEIISFLNSEEGRRPNV